MNISEWGHCFKMFANKADKKHFVLISREPAGHRLCLFVIMLCKSINHQPCPELCFFAHNIKRDV